MSTLPSINEMYQALVNRDAAYDGLFYACVKTTGIFCRPVCRARKPHPENVEFVATAREALFAGYRACKVCKPLDADPDRPDWLGPLLESVEERAGNRLTDSDLRAMSLDPARVRRYFKKQYGMTFQAYQRALRLGGAMKLLRDGEDLDRAGAKAGFDSTSGFRDAFTRLFGTPPGRGRTAGCLVAGWIQTPLGPMLAVASDDGLCLLEFVDRRAIEAQVATLRRRFDAAVVPGMNEHLEQAERELGEYFAGKRAEFDVAIDAPGTDFQQAVWDRLRRIPCGELLSYAQLALDIEHPGAQRAVGRANGDNRLAIMIPCHRVVRSDGTLCGYGGGVWRKKWLLGHEGEMAKEPAVLVVPS